MSELLNYYKNKKRLSKNKSGSKLAESKMSDEIDLLLQAKLSDDVLEHVFEVPQKSVGYVIEVIDKVPLVEKYIITQISSNIFSAKLREIRV